MGAGVEFSVRRVAEENARNEYACLAGLHRSRYREGMNVRCIIAADGRSDVEGYLVQWLSNTEEHIDLDIATAKPGLCGPSTRFYPELMGVFHVSRQERTTIVLASLYCGLVCWRCFMVWCWKRECAHFQNSGRTRGLKQMEKPSSLPPCKPADEQLDVGRPIRMNIRLTSHTQFAWKHRFWSAFPLYHSRRLPAKHGNRERAMPLWRLGRVIIFFFSNSSAQP